MGVNCCLTLPGRTKHEDVLNALAALAGNTCELKHHRDYSTYEWTTEAIKVQPSSFSPEYVYLDFPCFNDPHGFPMHEGQYSFEHDDEDGSNRFLYVKSTCWWIATCFRLAQMFGGSVVPNDCDGKVVYEVAYRFSGAAVVAYKFRTEHVLDVNGRWHAMQELTYRAEPLSLAELKLAERYASYPVKPEDWAKFEAFL
jgi:hypothetical protein